VLRGERKYHGYMQISQKYAEDILKVLDFVDTVFTGRLSFRKDPRNSFELYLEDVPREITLTEFEMALRLMSETHVAVFMPIEIIEVLDITNDEYKARPIGIDRMIGADSVPIAEIRAKKNYANLLESFKKDYGKYIIGGIKKSKLLTKAPYKIDKFTFSYFSSGLLKQPANPKATYSLEEGGRPYEVFSILKKHHPRSAYIKTEEIAAELGIAESDVRKAISGMKRNIKDTFKIKGKGFIDAKQRSGYKIAEHIFFVE
jgi:biotin operon repressor